MADSSRKKPLSPFMNLALLAGLGIFSIALADAMILFFARRLEISISVWLLCLLALADLAVFFAAWKALARVGVLKAR